MNSYIDLGDVKAHEETLYRTWNSFRNHLADGQFEYNDLNAALQDVFLKQFDDMFLKNGQKKHFEKRIKDFSKENVFTRGSILNGEGSELSYDRFIPDARFIKEDNRFSPLGVEWLYLSMGEKYDFAKRCSEKECKATNGDRFGLCQFSFEDKSFQLPIVDLTIAVNYDYSEIATSLAHISSLKRARDAIEEMLTYLLAKIITNSIFEPVETGDKKYMYAPFHCLACYFKNCGYKGIIYSSTVYENGKNIVLFDKEYATPTGVIEDYIVNV